MRGKARLSVLEDLVDPVSELGDPGVDPGLVLLRAPDAPADDAAEHVAAVRGAGHRHRAAAVPLDNCEVTRGSRGVMSRVTVALVEQKQDMASLVIVKTAASSGLNKEKVIKRLLI